MNGIVQIESQIIGGMEWTRNTNQRLGKLCIYPPVAHFIGIGQGIA